MRLSDVQGPLGNPTEIENFGHVVCIGGGVGVGVVYPLAAALKKAGNRVTSIIGARTKTLLILEEEMKKVSDKLIVATDDGSYGFHGFVSAVLQNLIDAKEKIDRVYAIGPVPMMRVVCNVTRPYGIKTIVSASIRSWWMPPGCAAPAASPSGARRNSPAWTAPNSTATRSISIS